MLTRKERSKKLKSNLVKTIKKCILLVQMASRKKFIQENKEKKLRNIVSKVRRNKENCKLKNLKTWLTCLTVLMRRTILWRSLVLNKREDIEEERRPRKK